MNEDKWKIQESEAENIFGETFKFINVLPMYGTEHHLSPGCWCEPEKIDDGKILIHKSDN